MTILFLAFLSAVSIVQAQVDSLPVRGLCIGLPNQENLDRFIQFIEHDLKDRKVNTLILRVDYAYSYESHPELRNKETLSKVDVKRLVKACRESGIDIIPQLNLLGHQSWASTLENLLKVYPEFDETPHISLPEKYVWPNEDALYCKSYCPLHPDVHKVVFELIDELCDDFEADKFHAGMDEVFYLADDKCPRCQGRDPASLFAGEVTKIRNHLSERGRSLWIWGDRLIDGKTTGIGLWEASFNNTARAIDMIPKDVVINDWHYEQPHQSAVYFAMKGFQVASCPWRKASVGKQQVDDMIRFRSNTTPEMKERFLGVIQTVWSGAGAFLDQYQAEKPILDERGRSQSECFKQIFPLQE